MAGVYARVKTFGIPNLLSILRIILIPFFIGLFFATFRGASLVAAGILILSGITDILDGIIARKFNMTTALGRILDPLADKLTQATVCVCLVILWARKGMVAPVVLLAVFIIKEMLMIIAGANIIRKGRELISAKWFGKLSTVVFYVMMIAIIAFPSMPQKDIYAFIIISLTFMLFSFIMYVQIFFKFIRKEK